MDKLELLSERLHAAKGNIRNWKADQEATECKINELMETSSRLQSRIQEEEQFIDILETNIRDLENPKGDDGYEDLVEPK